MEVDQAAIEKPDLGYQSEFSTSELDGLSSCLETHGFAILKDLLDDDVVDGLRQAVWDGTDPDQTLEVGQSRTKHAWIETGPGAWSLLENEPYMDIHRYLIGTDELTVHRTAAIIRMRDSDVVRWHSARCGFDAGPPKNSGDVLNRGLGPSGKWLYITGSRPIHGGLCVIADSHVENWQGPEGFEMMLNRSSFYPRGEEPVAYDGFDIPGLVPLFTNPGDMIIFAHRTYHGAFPNKLDEPRLSCGIGFRDRNHRIDIPWEIPESGQKFLADLPEHLQCYVDGYTSIDVEWKGE